MKSSVLKSFRSSPVMNRNNELELDPHQLRTRENMTKATELANRALSLERELRWGEALEAYGEVCSFFKRMMETADSKDLHDLLYLYQQYSKRLAFIKTKVFGTGLTSSQAPSPPVSPQSQRTNPFANQEPTAYSPPTPRFLRNRSDSYTNPTTPSPLANLRRPSLAPNYSLPPNYPLPPTPTSTSPRYTELHSKLSREIPLTTPNSNPLFLRSSPRTTEFLKDAHLPLLPDLEGGSPRRTGDKPLGSLGERNESKRGVDLNAIPENEEPGYESPRARGYSLKNDGSPPTQHRPRLAHNPSMPNLSLSRPTISGCHEGNLSRTPDPPFITSRRDSCAILSDWDFNRSDGFPSPADSASTLFDTTQARTIAIKATRPERSLQDNSTLHSPGASISSLIDSSPDSSPRLSYNSVYHHSHNSTSDDFPFPMHPIPNPITRAHTAPEGPPLSIYTQLPVRSVADLLSPTISCSSPLPNSENYSMFTPKYNLSIFQVLWNEEVRSKSLWCSPPQSAMLRPLWQVECLRQTLTTGGYVGSKRVFIDPSIWKQSGIRLPGLEVKIHVLTYLSEYLSRLSEHWVEDVLGIRQGLDELEALSVNMHQALASKLAVVPPIKRGQNSATTALFSLANKITKSVEKFQTTVSRDKMEGTASYLELLVSFFESCRFLEDWYRHYTNRHSVNSIHTAIVQRLQRFFDFLNSVIVAFVLHDLNTCLSKYLKRIRELALE